MLAYVVNWPIIEKHYHIYVLNSLQVRSVRLVSSDNDIEEETTPLLNVGKIKRMITPWMHCLRLVRGEILNSTR